MPSVHGDGEFFLLGENPQHNIRVKNRKSQSNIKKTFPICIIFNANGLFLFSITLFFIKNAINQCFIC